MEQEIADRFWSKVQRGDPSECWVWIGAKTHNGYGKFRIDGKMKRAHRVSYQIHKGPIPDGLFVLHICDNPGCVNPDHLHLGTQQDNMMEMSERGRSTTLEKHGRSKLTTEQVRQIRDRYATGTVTQLELGREFGVCRKQIFNIVNGKNWSNV